MTLFDAAKVRRMPTGCVSSRRRSLVRAALALPLAQPLRTARASGGPILVGLDLEQGDRTSLSDDAIALGVQTAVLQINRAGGLLGGRPLQAVLYDNRALPARGVDNVDAMAADGRIVAFFTGKFSAVAAAQIDRAHAHRLIMLGPWAAADSLIDHPWQPSYTFRLSLRDSWAVDRLVATAIRRGHRRVAALVPNNLWGRGSLAAARRSLDHRRASGAELVSMQWYNWGGADRFDDKIAAAFVAGADHVLLVANEGDGARFVKAMAERGQASRLPIFSHWGVLGGDFVSLAGAEALSRVQFEVVSTVVPSRPYRPLHAEVVATACRAFGVQRLEQVPGLPGLLHAHDLTWLLASAIARAGSVDRSAVRDAMERLPPFEGMMGRLAPPFTPQRHEALSPDHLRLYRFDASAALVLSDGPGMAPGRLS
jgi:branched-chain amino acid transport system substrate-binding protein